MRSVRYGFRSPRLALAGGFVLLVVAMTVALAGGRAQQPAAAPIDVYDGFETPALSNLWETSRFAPGAVEMRIGCGARGARGGEDHGAHRATSSRPDRMATWTASATNCWRRGD